MTIAGMRSLSSPIIFRCMKCGYCCSHLLNKTPFGTLGLFLMPQERKWFPKDQLVPMYAASEGKPEPKDIFSYQLNANICTWFEKRNQSCLLYKKRPLTCRAYPFESHSVIHDCRFMKMSLPEDESMEVIFDNRFAKNELAANAIILQYIRNQMRGKGQLWVWALDIKEWRKNDPSNVLHQKTGDN